MKVPSRIVWLLVAAAVVVVAAVMMMTNRRAEKSESRPATPEASNSSLLVMTWAPSLCKVETSASGCRTGRVGKLGQSFVLHGLWPQPKSQQYCNVPKSGRGKISLPPELQARLQDMMSDAAVMSNHEWYAHGSCSGVDPTEYFRFAMTLAEQAVEVLDPVFDGSVGRVLSSRSIREAFDNRYGRGAGSRVGLVCRDARGEGVVTFEVRLSLPAVLQLHRGSPSLGDALAAGPAVPPGCGKARVP